MKHPLNGNIIEVFLEEDKGLEFINHHPDRAIGVKLGEDGGLAFDANGGLIVSNPMVSTHVLRIKDTSNNTFDFNPTGATITESTPIDEGRKKKGLENILEHLSHPERAQHAEGKFGDLIDQTEASEVQFGE